MSYPTNLTENQWQVIKNIVENKERKRKYSLRGIVDGILYLVKTGCQWRMLPSDFAPWKSVYYYFNKWKQEGVFEELLTVLRERVRSSAGRDKSPSLGIIDSRSVKTSHHVDSDRGIDGNKKIKGRKQHLVVDTLGLPMAIAVHPANIYDGSGAMSVIEKLNCQFPRLNRILADGGYRGDLRKKIAERFGWELSVVLRPQESSKKFTVLPRRWIVERSFAWLEKFRRVTIDYEFYSETVEAMIQVAFISLMLKKM